MNNFMEHKIEQAEAKFRDTMRQFEAEHSAAQKRIAKTHKVMCAAVLTAALIPVIAIIIALIKGR